MFTCSVDIEALQGVSLEYVLDLVLSGEESSKEQALDWVKNPHRKKYLSDWVAVKELIFLFNPSFDEMDGTTFVKIRNKETGTVHQVIVRDDDCRSALCKAAILAKTETSGVPFVEPFTVYNSIRPEFYSQYVNQIVGAWCFETEEALINRFLFVYRGC